MNNIQVGYSEWENWTDVIMIRTKRDNRVVRESLGGFSGVNTGYKTDTWHQSCLSYGALLLINGPTCRITFNFYSSDISGILFMSSLFENCTILMFVINKILCRNNKFYSHKERQLNESRFLRLPTN